METPMTTSLTETKIGRFDKCRYGKRTEMVRLFPQVTGATEWSNLTTGPLGVITIMTQQSQDFIIGMR